MNRIGLKHERAIALFVLALLAFNPPLLQIFSAPELILGVPVLYIYLFCAWGGVILLVALNARRDKPETRLPPSDGGAAGAGDGR